MGCGWQGYLEPILHSYPKRSQNLTSPQNKPTASDRPSSLLRGNFQTASLVKSCKKEDLILVTNEIVENATPTAKICDIILNSDKYKGDPDFVKGVLEEAVTNRKLQEERQFQLEKLNIGKEFEPEKMNKKLEQELEKLKMNIEL
ncbi:hypothetical protein AVEN_169346-1 [Araneus ventricosus]|uniref:Uncharacterized protein n=1 Tax=Araneus ventricosus TaxID=182803 RepID=A0A4Y2VEQ8_ARAVE|nr:hypothetical protein AVEN_169346-1 [Araneus ventricosus]